MNELRYYAFLHIMSKIRARMFDRRITCGPLEIFRENTPLLSSQLKKFLTALYAQSEDSASNIRRLADDLMQELRWSCVVFPGTIMDIEGWSFGAHPYIVICNRLSMQTIILIGGFPRRRF